MNKSTNKSGRKTPRGKRSSSQAPGQKRAALATLNGWLRDNHDGLLKKAQENCLRLTGKPTFGAMTRRKSA
jgi:hypothetical protein